MDIVSTLAEYASDIPGSIQFEITRYALGTVTTLVAIWFIASHFIKGRKIRKPTPRARQIRMELKNSAITVLVFVCMNVFLLNGPLTNWFQIYSDPGQYGWLYFWLSIPLYLVLHDAYFYWTHRAMHTKRLYKYFHLTHHRSHNPTPFTAYNFAPGEALVEYGFVPIAVMLVPIASDAIFIVMTIMIFKNATGHCGYEIMPRSWARLPVLGWLTTVTHHDMHHERGTGNYGFYFTWWDRWMGTEHAHYLDRLDEQLANDRDAKTAKQGGLVAAE